MKRLAADMYECIVSEWGEDDYTLVESVMDNRILLCRHLSELGITYHVQNHSDSSRST
jgi:hypothetical protein